MYVLISVFKATVMPDIGFCDLGKTSTLGNATKYTKTASEQTA